MPPESSTTEVAAATPPDAAPGPLRAAIVQDATTGRVLMLGWMDAEAERRTRDTGQVWFWSRSRRQLWRKGETSGNTLAVDDLTVVAVTEDCDGDALLIRVDATGPTCHTGSTSCFAPELWRTITERARERPTGSYVTSLLEAGTPRVARKVGEEAVEIVVAALSEPDERLVEEAADLVFHLYVLLAARGIDVAQVDDELQRRAKPPALPSP